MSNPENEDSTRGCEPRERLPTAKDQSQDKRQDGVRQESRQAPRRRKKKDKVDASPYSDRAMSHPRGYKPRDKRQGLDEMAASVEEAEETEATAEVFEEVETSEATLVEPAVDEADELESTRAGLSEWIGANILNK